MDDLMLDQFLIGNEYALYEFDLEYIKTKTDLKGIDYEYYKYRGNKDLSKTTKIILVFNCDILRGVYVFKK